jgi:hypothetical protein
VVGQLQTNYFYIQEEIYLTSGAQTRDGQFIEVGWGFHNVLLGSRAFWVLRWMTLGTILGEVASQSGFT